MANIKVGTPIAVPKEALQVQEQGPAAETSKAQSVSGTQTVAATPTTFADGLPPGAVLVLTQSGKDADRATADAIRGANPNLFATTEMPKKSESDEAFVSKSREALFSSTQRSVASHVVQAGALELGDAARKVLRDAAIHNNAIPPWMSTVTPEWSDVRRQVNRDVNKLGRQVGDAARRVNRSIDKMGYKIGDAARATRRAIDPVAEALGKAGRTIAEHAPKVDVKLPPATQAAIEGAQKTLRDGTQAVGAATVQATRLGLKVSNTVSEGVKEGARHLRSATKALREAAAQGARRGLNMIPTPVKDGAKAAAQRLGSAATQAREGISRATNSTGAFIAKRFGGASSRLLAALPWIGTGVGVAFAYKDFKHYVKVVTDPTAPIGKKLLAYVTWGASTCAVVPGIGLPSAAVGFLTASAERILYPEPKASHA